MKAAECIRNYRSSINIFVKNFSMCDQCFDLAGRVDACMFSGKVGLSEISLYGLQVLLKPSMSQNY